MAKNHARINFKEFCSVYNFSSFLIAYVLANFLEFVESNGFGLDGVITVQYNRNLPLQAVQIQQGGFQPNFPLDKWRLFIGILEKMTASFYLLSSKYDPKQHAAFGAAVSFVIDGADGYFKTGMVMDHMTRLLKHGVTFDTEQRTEIGAWAKRSIVTSEVTGDVREGSYFAWADPREWNFPLPLVIYQKEDFSRMFFDCCEIYLASHSERREEFIAAMRANGYVVKRPSPKQIRH
ncbi:hypothetical protein [Roseateles amylovorans]|uniref:Uncharacterized protein n=1 Tax=Roseateles amylovorans TaxID=2978473 RepID=A0ABY6B7F8_9BURK|nr:hypothetical protein [Roseateles amylovorans]UXH80696.1 hypothetical protein N4261_12790 [Roseateles amylovorans]